MEETGAQWGDETTVGAGLPILNVLRTDLLATGDQVQSIEGIFSGTLSYIFNTYKPGVAFSDVVADAKSKGFTEPDPRDDLSGTDVARKVTILARQCGIEDELDSVPVQSLVPEALQEWQLVSSLTVAAFWQCLLVRHGPSKGAARSSQPPSDPSAMQTPLPTLASPPQLALRTASLYFTTAGVGARRGGGAGGRVRQAAASLRR